MEPVPVTATPASIAEAAMSILEAEGGGPMSLARLGQLVGKRESVSIRATLGSKPLSQLLRESFGDRLNITGEGAEIEVSIATNSTPLKRRYDASVFSAFSKPLEPGRRRWLRTVQPYKFYDAVDPVADPTAREIPASFIVSEEPDRQLKADKAEAAIARWTAEHGLDSTNYLKPLKIRSELARAGDSHPGLEALRSIVAAIPPGERKDLTLSLDLIAKLIGH